MFCNIYIHMFFPCLSIVMIELIRCITSSSHDRICQSITIGKDMMLVQNMCLVICYNRHASFVFLFLFPFFLDIHITTNHRDSISMGKKARIANVYCIKKKKKEKKEKVTFRFFFRHHLLHCFIQTIES
jgi:hypothetical protein